MSNCKNIGKCSIPIAEDIKEIADLIEKLSKKKGGATANELEDVNVLISEALMKIGIDKTLLTEIDRLSKCH